MNKIVHLSLSKKDVPIRIDVVQYATIPSIVFVLDDYTPGGSATANLYIKKPDGTEIYNSCTISGNQITYKPTTQSFAALGTNICQLQIIETSGTAVSFLVYADVTENIIDSSAIESQDEFTALEEALRTIASYENTGYWWRGVVPSGTDLNNVTTIGRYHYTSTATHYPDGVNWGQLEVLRSGATGAVIIQRVTANNRMYLRQSTNGGSTWSEWQTYWPISLLRGWTTLTATFRGLTITIKYNNAIPNIIRCKVYGEVTSALATANAYVTLATFTELGESVPIFAYRQINIATGGQLRITEAGALQIGYTRKFRDATNSDVASGEGVYLDETFIVG